MIALLTDFGLQDHFVGVMRGVIASIAPDEKVVDLCHGVPAQDIKTGALLLRVSAPYFPDGTIFVCVVDPKVGSKRRILWARTRRHQFLAPDNGLLSWLPDKPLEFRSLENEKLFLPEVSSTFHGRDVFSPVAARLATGLLPEDLGPKIAEPVKLPWPASEIIAIDRFGNAITSVKPPVEKVRFKGKDIPVGKTYADVAQGDAVAVIGSSGLLELCVRDGSFAARFAAEKGEVVDAA